MNIQTRNMTKEFVVLNSDKDASVEPADATLYQRLGKNYQDFKGHELIAAHVFESDWGTWEMHPHGDEIVTLISGEISFTLRLPEGEESVTLREAGDYVIVPKGVWHTANTSVKSHVLFITPGQGTQHSDAPE